jgi:hypothetical protein
MSRTKGLLPISGNFEPQTAAPLDGRLVVQSKASLTSSATWQALDGLIYVYSGIIVSVVNDSTPSNNGAYHLSGTDYTNIANWSKLGGLTANNPINVNFTNQTSLTINHNLGRQVIATLKVLVGGDLIQTPVPFVHTDNSVSFELNSSESGVLTYY